MFPVLFSSRQLVAAPLSTHSCRPRRREAKRAATAAGARTRFVEGGGDVASMSTSTTTTSFPPPPPQPRFHKSLIGLPLDELESFVVSELGEPRSRASQLYRWLYGGGGARVDDGRPRPTSSRRSASRWDLAPVAPGKQGGFSSSFLDKVRRSPELLDPGIELSGVRSARDGTRKLLFKVTAGPATGKTVDAVVIPAFDPSRREETDAPKPPPPPRLTLCVSSQAGCAMGCAFCLTGAQGLSGCLGSSQIVGQLVAARRWLREEQEKQERGEESGDDGRIPVPLGTITNVVFMGQGEPLDNLDAVVDAVKVMTDPRAGSSSSTSDKQWALSPNRVTVSTVGLVAQLRSLVERCDAQVALSLHAATEETRASIVPATARHGTAELREVLEELFPRRRRERNKEEEKDDDDVDRSSSSSSTVTSRAGRGKRRHCLIELTLLSGINDSAEDARRLVSYLEGTEAKVNLIPFNVHAGTPFVPPSEERVEEFRKIVVDEGGRVCTVRVARGADEAMAACGQLGEKVGVIPRAAERLIEAARG